MKKYKNLTKEDFGQIKILQATGLDKKLIVGVTNRGASTIERVLASDTYEEYRENLRAMHEKYKKPVSNQVDEQVDTDPVLEEIRASLSGIETTMKQTVVLLQALNSAAEEKVSGVRRFF